MAKNLKKAIAVLLALVMLLSVSSLGALAAEVREIPMGEEVRGGAAPAAVPAGNTRPAVNRGASARLMAQEDESGEGVASLNGTLYPTLQAAIDAAAAQYAASGEVPVVDLLADVTENVTVGKNLWLIDVVPPEPTSLVLNLNGHIMDGGHKDSVLVVYPDVTLTVNGDGGKITNGWVEGRTIGHANISGTDFYERYKNDKLSHPDLAEDNTSAGGVGGAGVCIFTRCDVTINDVEISGNTAEHTGSGYPWDASGAGVGVFGYEGDRNNLSNPGVHHVNEGTALYDSAEVKLNRVTITDNHSRRSARELGECQGHGGGLAVWHANVVVTDSVISRNSARVGGGVYICSGSATAEVLGLPEDGYTPGTTLTLINTRVEDNQAAATGIAPESDDEEARLLPYTVMGGGIGCETRSVLNVTEGSVISGNTAIGAPYDDGSGIAPGIAGGIHAFGNVTYSGDMRDRVIVNISDSTVSNNECSNGGGGIFGESGVILNMANSEITGNKASWGGGIDLYNADPSWIVEATITDSKINNNTVSGSGGGMYCDENSTVTVTGSELHENKTGEGYSGGAIYAYLAEVTVKDSSIRNNRGCNGGGVAAESGVMELRSTEIVDNVGVFCGGGVFAVQGATVNVDQSEISENTTDYYGGGVYADTGATVTLTETDVLKNTAGYYGGGAYATGGTVELSQCDISENTASYYGGGVYATGGAEVKLEESNVLQNTATTYGGGIYINGGATAKLERSNVLGNTAAKYGGGIYVAGTSKGNGTLVTVDHSVVANNVGTVGMDDVYSSYSSIQIVEPDYFGNTLLESDGRPISGWYVDRNTDDTRWAKGVYSEANLTEPHIYLKAAHGPYCDITYDLDGGTLGVDEEGNDLSNPAEYEPGFSTFTLLNPTRVGYTFLGWTGSNGEEAQTEVSVTTDDTGDLSYTANWELIDYTVTYDLDGGVTTSETTTFTAHYGDATPTIEAPTKAADETYTYVFAGWDKEVAQTVTGNATYTAQWTPVYKEFTVTYDLDGGSTTSEETIFTQHYGDATATIAQPTRAGYTFRGWEPAVAETVTADATYTAQWQRNSGGSSSRPSGGSTTTVEDLEDLDVPLANLPMLNTEDHVAYLVGKDDGTIAPLDHITRGEVATIFFRLLTEESRAANWATSCDYTDMDGTEYYNNPVSTATKAGLIKGYTDGTFGGGNKITRAEMATIAARFLSDPYSGANLFTDIDGHWASEYINRAAQAGWFRVYNGDGSAVGKFRPDDYITRAEVVVMINRMLERKVDMDHLLPGMKTWPDNVYSETTAWYYLDIQEAGNSHDYRRADAADVETWTELIANPDWTAMER